MNNCRTHIIHEAYKLFLSNNVEKVTIPELEKATKKSRGSIFYHFKDKIDLFNCIVNEIFLPQLEIPIQMYDTVPNVTFKQFVESYKSPEERAIEIIKKKYQFSEAEKCYFDFISQAYKYSPGFKEQYTLVFAKEAQVWKMVINRNKKNGQLTNSDSEAIANIMMFVKTGILFNKGHSNLSLLECEKTLLKLSGNLLE